MTRNRGDASKFGEPTKILAFDPNLKLTAIFSSYNAVEKITGKVHQSILKCCKGPNISCLGHYWRELAPDLEISADEDLDNLTLLEYDAAVGVNRKIYATNKMRKGEVILESQFKQKSYLLSKKRNGRNRSKD